MSGHGVIINMSTGLPFIFQFNPENIETSKKINYFSAPNVGGSYHEHFFTGFENKEVKFRLVCIDKENPLGVTEEVAYFEALREPAPGWLGLVSMIKGNANFPPPKVLFTFGTGSMVPLIYDIGEVSIKTDLFYSGSIRGVVGIPKRAELDITLMLDEENILYKANWIAKKATEIAASANSITREVVTNLKNTRREQPGIYPPQQGSKY